MLRNLANDQSIAIILIDGLSTDLPSELADLELALGKGDTALALCNTQTIKGLAISGGAKQLTASARELEKLCRENLLPEAIQYLPGLKQRSALALDEWQKFLIKLASTD